MRQENVRNADEVEVREMIKGRHNMRLRQLGKPAGSIALGATLTEVAPGGISFPATSTKKRSMSSPVPERRGSAMHTSLCGRETGLRCRPAPSTRTDGQRLGRRTARLSLYLDDARGGDC